MKLVDLIQTLDKTKTYVINEVGNSIEADIIQDLQHQVYKQYEKKSLPTHTFALKFVNNEWTVWENHLKWHGIKEYPAIQYESDATKFYINEYSLDFDAMDYHLIHNPGYSVLNLAEITEKRLLGKIPLPNTLGWVCSQSVAACNFDICLKLNLPFEVITPSDFYHYFQK